MKCRECKYNNFCRKYDIAKGSPACRKLLEGKMDELKQILRYLR